MHNHKCPQTSQLYVHDTLKSTNTPNTEQVKFVCLYLVQLSCLAVWEGSCLFVCAHLLALNMFDVCQIYIFFCLVSLCIFIPSVCAFDVVKFWMPDITHFLHTEMGRRAHTVTFFVFQLIHNRCPISLSRLVLRFRRFSPWCLYLAS